MIECLLKNSLEIQHRLTHPKDLADLVVTEDQLKAALGGLIWYLEHVAGNVRAGMQIYLTGAFKKNLMLVNAVEEYANSRTAAYGHTQPSNEDASDNSQSDEKA